MFKVKKERSPGITHYKHYLHLDFSDGHKAFIDILQCDKLNRQISSEDGRRWATSHGFKYYETSATSRKGVIEMLNDLLNTIIEHKMVKPKWIGDEKKPK